MKLYDSTIAPNPRRVRNFLAEKGITVPLDPVDIRGGVNRQPEFLAKNPMGGLPVLELDDGTCIAESLVICEYFEDRHPEPPLLGRTSEEKAAALALRRQNRTEWAEDLQWTLLNKLDFLFNY